MILEGQDKETVLKAALYAKEELLKNAEVDFVSNEKTGYDFINDNMLLLVDLADLYKTRDAIKDKIQKEKLGGLYIDFESDDAGDNARTDKKESFDTALKRYRQHYKNGIDSRYFATEDGLIYTLSIYPKNPDSSLGYFKRFGQQIEKYVDGLGIKEKFGAQIDWGYAGAIKTRVDEYDALMDDLKTAGLVSIIAIVVALFIYFRRVTAVVLVFIPMVMSTFWGFAFNSLFFKQLNVVTSFLFSIIFGLGVDIGIHLLTRYMQERKAGLPVAQVHSNLYRRTGKTCATSILTTVASFYVLVLFDFKGFSDFGWIAGNGLIIALVTYIVFLPPMILLADRFHLLKLPKNFADEDELLARAAFKRPHIAWAKPLFWVCILSTAAIVAGETFFDFLKPEFEYSFNKLKIQLPERVEMKKKLRAASGKVNSPAFYLIESEYEAIKLKSIITKRRDEDKNSPTIEFFASYYDLFPRDQPERLAVISEIDKLLDDDALNTLAKEDLETIAELRASIKKLRPISEKDVPADLYESFWGNTGKKDTSLALVAPIPTLELDDGTNAINFFDDVHEVKTDDKKYYAISDSIVFADMLRTLFTDSEKAVFYSLGLLVFLIAFHLRDFKRTGIVITALGTGIVWMIALMSYFQFKLNFYNMVVLPTMIGMGEDNSVHVIDRYEEVKRKSIYAVLKTTGGASFMASLTTILGYAGLLFTHHPGLKSIGIMSMIGMGTCLFGSLVMVPLFLHLFHKPVAADGDAA